MALFEKVQELFSREGSLALDKERDPVERDLQIATISVLLEAALCDEVFHSKEQQVILAGIQRDFRLDAKQAEELFAHAQKEHTGTKEIARSLKVIRDRYDEKQRKKIMGLIRHVIEADEKVNEFESAIYDFIEEKLGLQDTYKNSAE